MRLLQYNSDGEFSLTHFFDDIPPYAILSHTWGKEEVTFKDMKKGIGKTKAGFDKIRFCGEQARRDGLEYFWVDTCCIDKSSSTELAEAINSMFQWYRDAAKCYVLLSDVSTTDVDITDPSCQQSWESAFRTSRWFTRGWTLQELLAPESVEFFSQEGGRLGDKRTLEQQVHDITRIAALALRGAPLSQFHIEERFLWSRHRQTTREEDKVYSLFGIFDIQIPLIYGEGGKKAMKRLREEIYKPLVVRGISDYSDSYKPPGKTCHAFAVAGAAPYARESIEEVPFETWRTLKGGQEQQRPGFADQEAPLPKVALSQETPSSKTIHSPVSPTSLAIDENVFEVGPIRDLLVEIKKEFAKGRNWGLKPIVTYHMGVVTYSLLIYEKRDIAGTNIFHFLIGFALVYPAQKFLEFILEFIVGFFLEFISESIVEFSVEFIVESLFEAIHHFGLLDASMLFMAFYTILILPCIFKTLPPGTIYILVLISSIALFRSLILSARGILVFVMNNKFWTHGHLKLNFNDHVYDHTWAAIGTKEFRALKLELRATQSPTGLGVNEAQKGLLRFAFASLPMEFQNSEVRKKVMQLSEADHSGPSTEVATDLSKAERRSNST
ncbi:heterokaryon incompatibility protein-domain-containing protein [Cadophora sp. MPI-SDFR-AT-0126]|nr:heterokaryon incompatibility protein-domain-containing protein [Leotiomycetes sp. MPI-SDFR-AT-0126]